MKSSVNVALLRRWLLERDKKPEWLAGELEISDGTVYRMLRGEEVRASTVYAAAKKLGVELMDLAPSLATTLGFPRIAQSRGRRSS